LTGPETWYASSLPRGDNDLYIKWTKKYWSAGQISHEMSKSLYLGDAEKYYIVVTIFDDSPNITIHEEPFGYL
jgi:hypothetical protein